MSDCSIRTQLLQAIPAIARYHAQPLEDERNALRFWEQAASTMAGLDELLAQIPAETQTLQRFPAGTEEHVWRFLHANRLSSPRL